MPQNKTVASEKEDQSDAVVFYFHNKGASKYKPNWRDEMSQNVSYAYSLYWRKFMEYFLLERSGLCITAIAHSEVKTCGVAYRLWP